MTITIVTKRKNLLRLSTFLFLLFFAFAAQSAFAQIIQTPVNTALGGGGTAYTTGYESLFINPANLFIQEKEYRFQASAGTFGSYFASPLENSDLNSYWDRYQLQTESFDPGVQPGEADNYRRFINRNYPNGLMTSENQSRGEIHWIGMHWSRLDKSYAIALRSRYSNRYITGRNYYDPDPVELNSNLAFNRSLTHQFQSLHELSFGYAESFTFINGLIPQLSQLIVGIAPKFVVSGAHLNTRYEDRYTRSPEDPVYHRERSFSHYSTGAFSEMTNRFLINQEPYNPRVPRDDLFRPTGYGAGLDLGLTYLITLGDDLSVLRVADPRTRKSLRLSLSITDIGFIYHSENPRHFSFDEHISQASQLPGQSDFFFQGRPGEQFRFLEANEGHPIFDSDTNNTDTFSSLLPTAVHAGLLFQVSRLKLMGDFSFGLVDNMFHTTRPTTYLGTEIRLLSFLPLRAGIRMTPDLPDYVSIGTGIETRYFDLNVAVQLRSRMVGPIEPMREISGFSMAGLKIYIP